MPAWCAPAEMRWARSWTCDGGPAHPPGRHSCGSPGERQQPGPGRRRKGHGVGGAVVDGELEVVMTYIVPLSDVVVQREPQLVFTRRERAGRGEIRGKPCCCQIL